MSEVSNYSEAQLFADVAEFVKLERASDYSKAQLNLLWEKAIAIRKVLLMEPFNRTAPYEFTILVGNIDFGAIESNWRDWILEDAEKILNGKPSRYIK